MARDGSVDAGPAPAGLAESLPAVGGRAWCAARAGIEPFFSFRGQLCVLNAVFPRPGPEGRV